MVVHVVTSQVVALLANVASVFILLKLLPVDLYGKFAFSISILLLAAQLSRAGMQSVVLKCSAKRHCNYQCGLPAIYRVRLYLIFC